MEKNILILLVILFDEKGIYRINGDELLDLCPSNLPRNEYLTVYRNKCYRYISTALTWPNAQTECNKDGGFIAEVLGSDTNAYFLTKSNGNRVWIGFQFNHAAGEWQWENGNPVNYTNWDRTQPCPTCNEDCAVIDVNGRWHDYPCSTPHPFFCEYAICGAPPAVTNGTVLNGETIFYNVWESINYSCNQGFVNIASKLAETSMTCQKNGVWEETPICVASCGTPESVQNANVSSGGVFIPGESVTYTCQSGFVVPETKESTHSITCTDNGKWEQEPSCIVTCPTPQAGNDAHLPSSGVYIPGDEVIFVCKANFVIASSKESKVTITCRRNGNWNQEPSCLKTCGPPPNIGNSVNNATGSVYTPDDNVTYTCNSNYAIPETRMSKSTITCQNNGEWSKAPICTAVCGPPESVGNATVSSGSIFIAGETVKYTCLSGYVIPETRESDQSITCTSDAKWEEKPSCVTTCSTPNPIQNAFIPPGSIYIPGDEVTITCNPSYVMVGTKESKTSITCSSDGSWDQDPVCTRDCGPAPVVPHSTNNATDTVFTRDDVIMYTCDNDYVMSGNLLTKATIQCGSNGFWSETPICIVNCNTPPSVQHASKSDSGSIFTPGDYVTWTCNDGFVVKATNLLFEKVICRGNGTWTASPICVAFCGEHPVVDHAEVHGTGSQQGHRRTYTCNVGHTLVGSPVIQCGYNSLWEEPPACPAECGEPPTLPKGFLTGSGTLENNTRNATCKDAYILEGSSTIKCQMNGQWEAVPQCTAREIYKFKQSMFGADKSPISTQTGIALVAAIILGLLLIGIAAVYFYNLCKEKRKIRKNAEREIKRNTTKKSNISDPTRNPNRYSEIEIYIPHGPMYKGDRLWHEVLY